MGLLRGKIRWTIPGAGAAFTVLHFGTSSLTTPTQADADAAVARMQAWATAIKAYLPNVVSLNVQAETEEINDSTGAMIGVWTSATPTTQTGTASATATWAAPTGAVVTWNTASVRNGRRVRGRTFLVPLSSEAFATDGTLSSVAFNGINTAATNLRLDGPDIDLRVFMRPTAPGAADGDQALVQAHRLPDMAAILTSRRS